MVNNITVGQVSNSSGIFVGLNSQPGWNSFSKQNASINFPGSPGNLVNGNVNILYDNDAVDIPSSNRDIFYPGP